MPISSTGRSRYKQERSHNHFDEPFFCQVVRVSRFPPFFILRALYADNWRLQGNDPLCKLKTFLKEPFLGDKTTKIPFVSKWPKIPKTATAFPFVNAPKNCSWQDKLWARISGPIFLSLSKVEKKAIWGCFQGNEAAFWKLAFLILHKRLHLIVKCKVKCCFCPYFPRPFLGKKEARVFL